MQYCWYTTFSLITCSNLVLREIIDMPAWQINVFEFFASLVNWSAAATLAVSAALCVSLFKFEISSRIQLKIHYIHCSKISWGVNSSTRQTSKTHRLRLPDICWQFGVARTLSIKFPFFWAYLSLLQPSGRPVSISPTKKLVAALTGRKMWHCCCLSFSVGANTIKDSYNAAETQTHKRWLAARVCVKLCPPSFLHTIKESCDAAQTHRHTNVGWPPMFVWSSVLVYFGI